MSASPHGSTARWGLRNAPRRSTASADNEVTGEHRAHPDITPGRTARHRPGTDDGLLNDRPDIYNQLVMCFVAHDLGLIAVYRLVWNDEPTPIHIGKGVCSSVAQLEGFVQHRFDRVRAVGCRWRPIDLSSLQARLMSVGGSQ